MNKSLFSKYATLKKQIKELEDKVKELQPQLIPMVQEAYDNGKKGIESDDGLFTINVKKTWIYTEAVAELIQEVKEKKAEEEALGHATFDEVKILVFKEKK